MTKKKSKKKDGKKSKKKSKPEKHVETDFRDQPMESQQEYFGKA